MGTSEVTIMKRKRDLLDRSSSSFLVHQIGQSAQLYFEPITTILRAHLPLAWLAAAPSQLPAGAVVEGHVKCVEKWEYHILFARQLPNGGLHVFERIDGNTYTVYPVQPFVSESWVHQAAIGATPPLSLQSLLHYATELEPAFKVTSPSRKSSLAPETSSKLPRARPGAAARTSILGSIGTVSVGSPYMLVDSPKGLDSEKPGQEEGKFTITNSENETTLDTAQSDTPGIQEPASRATDDATEYIDHLAPEYLRQRYLEMLYTTKTSLAYYAKGPLSRARARARVSGSSMNSLELAAFYRDGLLPHKKLDIKYRESIKNIITNSMDTNTMSGPTAKTIKKRRLGKDGLWPVEPDYIAKWWRSRPVRKCDGEAERMHEIDAVIVNQRMREMQLQVLLMLEILSIEAKDPKELQIPQGPEAEVRLIEDADDSTLTLKQKRLRDVEADLNLLADKLCIWHSIGIETVIQLTERDDLKRDHQMQTVHDLRNFCVDVIVPFYSSKLPLICKDLCKTLAGSALAEQAFRTQVKSEPTKIAPGADVARRVPSDRTQMPLDDRRTRASQQQAVSMLHRSSTLPALRRETSQVLQQDNSRSRSIQRSASLVNREMDLTLDAQITASKKRKLDLITAQKHELGKAIQALKRPDRSAAGQTYMDEVARRLQTKKSVQIDATPSHKRSRRNMMEEDDDGFELPVTSRPLELIPSSSSKSRGHGLSRSSRASATKRAVLSAIHDTPSKHSTHPVLSARDVPVTPMEEIPQLVFATPVKIKPVSASIEAIFRTPKHRRDQSEKTFEIPVQAGQAMKRAMLTSAGVGGGSIYDTLGWDADYNV